MSRYFIHMAYDGTNYCGWQRQPNAISIQEEVEKGLTLILRNPVTIVGAGRTDTGVHAESYYAHFDWAGDPLGDLDKLRQRLDDFLKEDIVIFRIYLVDQSLHARFSALSRTYQYRISTFKEPFERHRCLRIKQRLDFERMNEACQILLSYHDFGAFAKLHSPTKTNICHIKRAQWVQQGTLWVFTIQADRFLRNMVRAIVGTLFMVGYGKIDLDAFRAIIEGQDRGKAGVSVSAKALSLVDIEY